MRTKLTACGLFIAIAVAGCGGAQPKCNDAVAPQSKSAEVTTKCGGSQQAAATENLTFELIAEDKLPAELSNWKTLTEGSTKIKNGSLEYKRLGEHLYVAVIGGERPSGGYRVEVQQVKVTAETERDVVNINAKVVGPPPGSGATAAITYPRAYLRIPYEAAKRDVVVYGQLELTASAADQAPEAVAAKPKPVVTSPPVAVANPEGPAPKSEAPKGEVQFQAVDPKILPKELQGWALGARGEAGISGQIADATLYLQVFSGEQPTGGYRVEIRKVEMLDGEVRVQAVLHKPAPGAMVTQAITYPKAFAKVSYSGTSVPKLQVEWVQ